MVNIGRDATFAKVHSTEWTTAVAPSQLTGERNKNKEILLVVDSGAWYVWLAFDDVTNKTLVGWTLQE